MFLYYKIRVSKKPERRYGAMNFPRTGTRRHFNGTVKQEIHRRPDGTVEKKILFRPDGNKEREVLYYCDGVTRFREIELLYNSSNTLEREICRRPNKMVEWETIHHPDGTTEKISVCPVNTLAGRG